MLGYQESYYLKGVVKIKFQVKENFKYIHPVHSCLSPVAIF